MSPEHMSCVSPMRRLPVQITARENPSHQAIQSKGNASCLITSMGTAQGTVTDDARTDTRSDAQTHTRTTGNIISHSAGLGSTQKTDVVTCFSIK